MSSQATPASAEDQVLVRVEAVLPKLSRYAPDIALTGGVKARIQANLAFLVDGKVTERRAEVGQHVDPDTILATLDPADRKADVESAKAGVEAAQAMVVQVQTDFQRQQTLLVGGYTTRASFDQAQEALNSKLARANSAAASLQNAQEQLSYTDLKAGASGTIVSNSVEVGQVVQAGQTMFVLAQDGERDAVFKIYEAIVPSSSKDKIADIALEADPSVKTTGTVRQISPRMDPASNTVEVTVGLDSTPPRMTLGAAVVGRGRWDPVPAIAMPWTALFEWKGKPAVWIVDDQDMVSPKAVEIQTYLTETVIIKGDLDPKRRVVTAGIQFLHPGQKVSVAEAAPP